MEDALSEADIPSLNEYEDQMLLTLKLMEFAENGKMITGMYGMNFRNMPDIMEMGLPGNTRYHAFDSRIDVSFHETK